MSDTTAAPDETVIVLNPQSGSGSHVEAIRDRATSSGYEVQETQRTGHAIELARSARDDGYQRVVAAGGDGTLNEVLFGLVSADGLDEITAGVIPCGTGNNFATNIGISTREEAFALLEDGQVRRLDLGFANDRPFINSCVGGITANASAETDSGLKSRLGVLAYVVTTLRTVSSFDGLDLTLSVWDGETSEPVWDGNAACILIGNGRRFSHHGSEQANIEDGLLDVTIIEEASSVELVEDRLLERLLGADGDHINRMLASSIQLDVDGTTEFSLDGEMIESESVSVDVHRQTLGFLVGEGYEPNPTPE